MKKASNLRKEILINPKFQLKILAWFLIPVLIVMTINYYFLLSLMYDVENLLVGNTLATAQVQALFNQFNLIYVISFAVLIFALITWGVIITFRIAGPAYNMKKYFSEMDLKELKAIKLRKNDYLQDVSDAFNNNINKYKNEE
jgi:fatty acid desaturase